MRHKKILFLLIVLLILTKNIYADQSKKLMEIHFDTSGNYIFSNNSDITKNKGKFIFSVSTLKKVESVDVMVSLENTDNTWRFNKVELSPKDGRFFTNQFTIEWNGMDKNSKQVIDGQYNIKIFVVDSNDISIEDNTHNFNVDNTPPDIRKININPDEKNTLKITAEIFDDSEVDKANMQFINKSGSKEDVQMQINQIHKGEYFCNISLDKISAKSTFEGNLNVTDKASGISIAKFALTINPEIKIKTEGTEIFFNTNTLPHEFKLEGTFIIGKFKTNINETFENTDDLTGNGWIKKIEFRNLSNDKIAVPTLNGSGDWEVEVKEFLSQGDNKIEYVCSDYLGGNVTKIYPLNIKYDVDNPSISSISFWAGTKLMAEMNEKVKIIIDQTLFEIDIIKPTGAITIYTGVGRLINSDTNIEIEPSPDFQGKAEKGDKILVRIIKITDMSGNKPDKIESQKIDF